MDTQTTTLKKISQVMALVLVLVAVSACSKKEGSKASVRNRNNRTQTYTPTNGTPGSTNSQFGTIQTSQQAIYNFLGTNDPSVIGQVTRVVFQGYVSDGYTRQAGGEVTIYINDNMGEIKSNFGDCDMQVPNNGNQVTVTCYDGENNAGSITFYGNVYGNTYSGQVYFDRNNQQLGNFSVNACAFLDAGC